MENGPRNPANRFADFIKNSESALTTFHATFPIDQDLAERLNRALFPPGSLSEKYPPPTPAGDFSVDDGVAGSVDGADIAIDGAGYVYIADVKGGRIRQFDAEGRFRKDFGGGEPLQSPTGIAYDAQGNVYVLDARAGRIFRFDARGFVTATFGEPDRFKDPTRMLRTADGRLYVVDRGAHKILRFAPDGRFELEWGQFGEGPGQFRQPGGIAAGPDGNIYVTDELNARVQKFTPDGTHLLDIGGKARLESPGLLARHTAQSVQILDTQWSGNALDLKIFSIDGLKIGQVSIPAGITRVASMVQSDAGAVYFSDTQANRIVRMKSNGEADAAWNAAVANSNLAILPGALAAAGDESLFAVVRATNSQYGTDYRVLKISSTGAVSLFSADPMLARRAADLVDLAVLPDGGLCVAINARSPNDGYRGIQRYDRAGRYLGDLMRHYPLESPSDMLIDPADRMYVNQDATPKVAVFSSAFQFAGSLAAVRKLPPDVDVDVETRHLAFDPAGNTYISRNRRIEKYDASGTPVSGYAANFGQDYQLRYQDGMADFDAICVDNAGNLYGVRRAINRIVKFDANGNVDAAWTDAANLRAGAVRFKQPDRCVTDGAQRLYVLERNTGAGVGRVQVLNLADAQGDVLNLQGALDANHQPHAIAATTSALVVIGRGAGASAPYRFAPDGSFDAAWSSAARAAVGPAADLWAAAFTSSGALFVLDLRRATAFQLTGSGQISFACGAMAFFSRPARIGTDAAGRLWVYDAGKRGLYRFAANFSGEAQRLGGFPETALENVRDLRIFGSLVYVIRTNEPGVQVFDLESGARRPDLAGANPFTLPGGVDFDREGRLCVSDFTGGQGAGSGLHYYRLTTTGQRLAKFAGPPDISNSQYSFHIGRDGFLYWSWMNGSRYYRIAPDDRYDADWSQRISTAAGVLAAGEFLPLPDGRFILSDPGNRRVRILDAGGQVEHDWQGGSPYKTPRNIAADENGNIFVLDHTEKKLCKVAQNGAILWQNKTVPVENLTALSYREGRGLFLLTAPGQATGQTRILRIDPATGAHSLWWSEADQTAPIFYTPRDIAVAPDGSLYVGEGYGNRVTKFTPDAALAWRKHHKQGSVQFLSPESLAIDGEGYLYVFEGGRGAVSILDQDAHFYTDWGGDGPAEARLGGFPQIAVSPAGAVYVLERQRFRVRRFTTWPSRPVRDVSAWTTVVDLRGRQWASQFKQLSQEYDFARERFQEIEDLYATRMATGLATAAEILELEDRCQGAFRELLRVQTPLEDFKSYLALQGVGVGVSHEEITQELAGIARADEQRLRALHKTIPDDADLREFRYRDGEYYDQYGLSLQASVRKAAAMSSRNTLFLIPFETDANGELTRVFLVRNAAYSGRQIQPPIVTFEENYQLKLVWQGASRGEFSHSIGLLPGEARELELTASRKRTFQTESKAADTSSDSQSFSRAVKSKRNDDFQSNVSAQFKSDKRFNTAHSRSHTSTSSSGASADFGFKDGDIDFSLDSGASGSSDSTTSASSSYSSDHMRNSVAAVVRNAAGEVSRNNKVSFRESTDIKTEFETRINEEDLDHDVQKLRLKNINEGRTVNYLFFQIANNYASELFLESVRVRVSTGIEILPGTGIVEEKIFDLANFGRLLKELDVLGESQRGEVVAVVAQHVLRRYLRLPEEAPSGARLLTVDPASFVGGELTAARLKTLRNDAQAPPAPEDDRYRLFESRLRAFAGLRFSAAPVSLGLEERYCVNSGKYFVDAQVGRLPATESYLEDRRAIEVERQRALVEDLRARTAAGVFIRELPDSIEELRVSATGPEEEA